VTLGKAHRHSRDSAENALERAIRQVALLAHTEDNNATSGPAFKALFPNGLDAELRPIGASQVTATVALRGRLDAQASRRQGQGPNHGRLRQGTQGLQVRRLFLLGPAKPARPKSAKPAPPNPARASASSLPTTPT